MAPRAERPKGRRAGDWALSLRPRPIASRGALWPKNLDHALLASACS
jgi:hypothetical protein